MFSVYLHNQYKRIRNHSDAILPANCHPSKSKLHDELIDSFRSAAQRLLGSPRYDLRASYSVKPMAVDGITFM